MPSFHLLVGSSARGDRNRCGYCHRMTQPSCRLLIRGLVGNRYYNLPREGLTVRACTADGQKRITAGANPAVRTAQKSGHVQEGVCP